MLADGAVHAFGPKAWYERRRWRPAQVTTQVFQGSVVAKVITYSRLEDVGNDKR
jgi:hypothetical protein